MREAITVIGGGLAGCEAAWQIARHGERVRLYEMRPVRPTPAHRTDRLAEIVCSNSLKSDQPYNASWLLKEELRRLGSILIQVADSVRVPAGSALAVDRERFASRVTELISTEPKIELVREEKLEIPGEGIVIVASGPLTSASLSQSIQKFCGSDHLYFYDAISPIVDAETIDRSRVYRASRYGKASGDYLNCPMDRDRYSAFYDALIAAESVTIHEFEEACYFESCLPIEELARRGRDTLRFGPMRPVGLDDPATGRIPYAVVQLRQEDLMQSSYNIVGFQNHLKFQEQKKIFRMIPGLENAEFLRLGQIHRNTYINAPDVLLASMAARRDPRVFFAGQLAGTEGYIENVASGLVAGINAVRHLRDEEPMIRPAETAIGALCRYVSTPQKHFAPMNINFGLLPPVEMPRRTAKTEKHRLLCERALELCRPTSTSMA
ncbi:MAG: methylenetetrahydrofolate--tRNA-(uracil(54)-C(5))-methyltransferase (FADH(2)-oxidizing) TrmFO [Acidobacteria bacterium 13_1_20CM_2_57_8]|nr:MAG: methylenetetrahydrofolate--tRNA-(uracil(54)-C(5))-methyltransferase (FADH(2)-oxidizing) TrmFO [Acidobacteria bacterium 13_1_20CM_2_57_8]